MILSIFFYHQAAKRYYLMILISAFQKRFNLSAM